MREPKPQAADCFSSPTFCILNFYDWKDYIRDTSRDALSCFARIACILPRSDHPAIDIVAATRRHSTRQ